MKDYHSSHMVKYKPETDRCGHDVLELLPFLKGHKWDEVALAYVHSLRPSSIRVTSEGTTLDARTWRVTVYIDNNDVIEKIEQEVEVWLPKGVAHGEALDYARVFGIDSEQCKWHLDAEMTYNISRNVSPDGKPHYYKTDSNGNVVEFPRAEI